MRGHAVIQSRQQYEFALCPVAPLPLRAVRCLVAHANCTLLITCGQNGTGSKEQRRAIKKLITRSYRTCLSYMGYRLLPNPLAKTLRSSRLEQWQTERRPSRYPSHAIPRLCIKLRIKLRVIDTRIRARVRIIIGKQKGRKSAPRASKPLPVGEKELAHVPETSSCKHVSMFKPDRLASTACVVVYEDTLLACIFSFT